jgi:hypothetical protein
MADNPIEVQVQAIRKKLTSAASTRKTQIMKLRAKAADAALNWVMSHQSRVDQFKGAVKGTPMAGVVDKLLAMLKSEASTPKKKAAAKKKPAAKKAAKKAPAKKAAAKKPAKKAAKRK